MSWLETHIEEFVRPVVGSRITDQLTASNYFEQEELTIIKNTWRSVKKNANGRQILLPGRDVFVFEILAKRENYPTVFMPECSRMTVRELAQDIGPIRNCYLFDTGFAGSIPRNLRMKNFGLMSYSNYEAVGTQVFPRLTLSRGLALRIEATPKYWQSGRLGENNEVIQPQSHLEEFIAAARLTIEVYTNSSPKFINHNKPLSERRW